jgi:hypothetical protein
MIASERELVVFGFLPVRFGLAYGKLEQANYIVMIAPGTAKKLESVSEIQERASGRRGREDER